MNFPRNLLLKLHAGGLFSSSKQCVPRQVDQRFYPSWSERDAARASARGERERREAVHACVRARVCVWSKGRREEGVKPLARGLLQLHPERRPGRPRSKSRGIRRREGWVEHRARRLERRPRRREGNKYEQGKVVGAFRERPRTAKAATKLVCSRPDLTTTPFSLLLSLDFDRV